MVGDKAAIGRAAGSEGAANAWKAGEDADAVRCGDGVGCAQVLKIPRRVASLGPNSDADLCLEL